MTSRRQYASLPKPLTSEFSAPSGAVCIQVKIPDALVHLYLMQGMLAKMTDADFWDGPEADRKAIAAVWQQAYTDTEWEFCLTPTQAWQNSEINCWVHEAEVIAGNALALSADTGQYHNIIGLQNAPSVNSKLRWTRYMAAGVWNFAYLYKRLSNGGVIDIYVTPPAGSTVTALNDHDTRGTTLNNQFARGSFTIVTSGEQIIEVEVVSSSSGSNYGNTFTLLQMWRTDD